MNKMKRLGIFVGYDADGIYDNYVFYLLEQLKLVLDRLIVVINGEMNKESEDKFYKYTDEVIIRENQGFDFGAWKYVVTEYLGSKGLDEYQEMVLVNDSCFGPFSPFESVFSAMGARNLDFWGLIAHGEVPDINPYGLCPYGYLPEHIQSSFIVIKDKLLHHPEFMTYWKELPDVNNYQEAVAKIECVFTKYFSDLGYKWGAYIETKDMDGSAPTAHSFFSPGQLILRGMPMLKVKAFSQSMSDLLNVHMGDDLAEGLSYIRNHTSYDEEMIFQHILRKCNIADIHDTLHLDYIVSDKATEYTTKGSSKVLVLLHLYYLDLLEAEISYLENIPSYMDILITTTDEERKSVIEKTYKKVFGARLKVIVMENRGREAAALLVAAREYILKYDFVCFVQDKKSAQVPYTTGASFGRLGWENMLCSKAYIENIMGIFEKEPYLGVLVPPRFFGGQFLENFATNLWTICYEKTVAVANQLNLKVNIVPEKGIICTNSMFWARTKALEPLLTYEWKYTDFEPEPTPVDGALRHVIERILQFVAQDRGFYTGIVMTEEYASIQTSAFFYLVQREMQKNIYLSAQLNNRFKTKIKIGLKKILPKTAIRFLKNVYYKVKN